MKNCFHQNPYLNEISIRVKTLLLQKKIKWKHAAGPIQDCMSPSILSSSGTQQIGIAKPRFIPLFIPFILSITALLKGKEPLWCCGQCRKTNSSRGAAHPSCASSLQCWEQLERGTQTPGVQVPGWRGCGLFLLVTPALLQVLAIRNEAIFCEDKKISYPSTWFRRMFPLELKLASLFTPWNCVWKSKLKASVSASLDSQRNNTEEKDFIPNSYFLLADAFRITVE